MSDKRYYSLFPKALSDCVERLTRPVMKAHGLSGSRLITDWRQVMGEAVAARCVPQKLSYPPGKNTGGTLTIAVENGFSTELHYMQPMMLERLTAYFGYKAVSRIVVSHSYSAAPKPPATTGRAAATVIDSESIAAQVEDEELQSALRAMAETLSGQRT